MNIEYVQFLLSTYNEVKATAGQRINSSEFPFLFEGI
jgi:hypothetical protein